MITTQNTAQLLKKFILTSLASSLFVLLCACSEDSGQQKISQQIKPQEKTTKESPENNDENTLATDTNKDDKTPKVTSIETKVIEKDNPQSVEQQLNELQANLNDNNQENAALRQHMEVLLKKVQENQRTIDKLEQQEAEPAK